MDNSVNIWKSILESPVEQTTDRVKAFMNEKCDELRVASGGTIKARFMEIKLRPPIGERPLTAYETAYAQAITTSMPKGIIDENDLGLKDAGASYSPIRYGFDVYNDTYEFRPFVATVGAVYPIFLAIDETISKESKYELSQWIDSEGKPNIASVNDDNELNSCFYVIAKSRKMKYVLNKLMNKV